LKKPLCEGNRLAWRNSQVKPADGGTLITRAASADVGAQRYTAKVNWRRDLTDEMTREGVGLFQPASRRNRFQGVFRSLVRRLR